MSGVLSQEAQLSQRDPVMLRIIEYFAKSLKVTKVTGNGTIRQIAYEFRLAFHGNYGPTFYRF